MPEVKKTLKTVQPTKKLAGISAWGEASYYHMLLYGASGTGKTTLWSTFPGRILALICSGSSRPGELKSIDTPENRKKIEPRIVTSTEMVMELLKDSDDFTTIVLDHASSFEDLAMKEVLNLDRLPTQKYWGMAKQEHYLQVAAVCKETFSYLLSLPKHVVVVAQETINNPKQEGTVDHDTIIKPTIGAALIPSIAKWLNPACSYVVQTYKRPKMIRTVREVNGQQIESWERGKGIEYCLRTDHDVAHTKFRMPIGRSRQLPEMILNPTFDKIDAIVRGTKLGEPE